MNKLYFLLIPLVLSGFTHLWNPVGYPDIFFDEGIYMRRAMNFLDTGNPQESFLYDHPYFGQIVIASILTVTNYSNTHTSPDVDSLKSLYMIPRIFMGVLAVLDTFLIYMIVKTKYNRDAAFLSSILFAVLPFTWVFKRILLDSILVPLVLGAILLAVYSSKVKQKRLWIIFSGILLGLAVFTKIPAFTIVFIVVWIVYTNRKKISDVLFLLIPFLLIPLIWPINAIMLDQFDLWQKDLLWQANRANSITGITEFFFIVDPMMFVLGLAGIGYAALRRDKFLLLWFVPFIIFLSVIGYKQYFHWIVVIPVMCIAGGVLLWFVPFIIFLSVIGYKQYFHWMVVIPVMCIAGGILLESFQKFRILEKKYIHTGIISAIIIFSFTSTTLLIINDISDNQFQALSYILKNYNKDFTILASPTYSWILHDVFGWKNVLKDYSEILFYPITSEKMIIVEDPHYRIDLVRGPQLQTALDNSKIVQSFEGTVKSFDSREYPYTSIQANFEASDINIREWSKPK